MEKMYKTLFIGNEIIRLVEVDSTNNYAQKLVLEGAIEGCVVVADKQWEGKGQRGSFWESEDGKNLTFSVVLRPNFLVSEQFVLNKLVALGLLDLLADLGIKGVSIKWPNDIYIRNKKMAGILIENTVRGNQIKCTVVGIGLNVNQVNFSSNLFNPTSLGLELGKELDLEMVLNRLLFFMEKRYLLLKLGGVGLIDREYLGALYGLNVMRRYRVRDEVVSGKIKGIAKSGKLLMEIKEVVVELDLKEVVFFG